jgi:hypothetical protein
MRVVNFSEARKSLKMIIDQVIVDSDYTVIARRDAPDAVVMSLEHLQQPDGNGAFAEIAGQCGAFGSIN